MRLYVCAAMIVFLVIDKKMTFNVNEAPKIIIWFYIVLKIILYVSFWGAVMGSFAGLKLQCIYIYRYIVILRQTVSLYHNSSVWLDT